MAGLRSLLSPLRVPPGAEDDPGFREVVVRHTRWGMALASVLGIVGAVVFVGMQLASGRRLALAYPDATDTAVVVADEVVIVALCLALIAAAQREALVARWGRPLLAAVLVTAATASMVDDAARGDYTFSIAWAGLMAVVVFTAAPFRPLQAAATWGVIAGVFGGLLLAWPDTLSTQIAVDRVAYAAFAAIVVTCLSALLYAGRFRQYQAFQRADALRAALDERGRELEASLDRLAAAQDRAAYAEKMAALGQFASGLAHEVQNPLNFVTNFAEVSEELVEDALAAVHTGDAEGAAAELGDLQDNLDRIRRHGERASGIVRRMREHTGERKPPAAVRLNPLVAEAVETARKADPAGEDIAVDLDLDPAAGVVEVSALDLQRALLHIVENALWAAGAGEAGPPRVAVQTRRLDGHAVVRVSDTGPGIDAGVGARVFEPFFTTRPTGEGVGLGLSLAYDTVVQGHGGDLRFETEPGAGTTFIVEVPVGDR